MDTDSKLTTTKPQKIAPSLLDAFELLRKPNNDSKVIGGTKIISSLHGVEVEGDIQYVLRRLIRSLGANLPDVRTGYFATLVALFAKFEQITVMQVLDLMKKELHATKTSKSEAGDVALGQILVCAALFRSKQIFSCKEEEQKEVVQNLLTASKKKSYLTTTAYLILLNFAKTLNESQFASILWSTIKQELKKNIKEHNLDSLYCLIVLNNKFPGKVKLRKLIGTDEIFCEDNVKDICDKLMSGIDFNTVNHPIFKEIGALVANSPHLLLFWEHIDFHLVKHNRNRELVAINLLTAILNALNENANLIPNLISKNFFKLFIDWFKGLQTASKIRSNRDDEDDHRTMIKKEKELLDVLAKASKSANVESKVRVEVLKKLLVNPGEMNFNDLTGTSIIKNIVVDLEKDGVKKMAKLFKGILMNTSKKILKDEVERGWYNNERLKAAEFISHLVSHESVKDDVEFKLSYMKLLLCFGFFKTGGDDNVVVNPDLAGAIKSCFYRCFSSRFSNVDNLVQLLSSLSTFVDTALADDTIRKKLDKQFPKESMECWEMIREVTSNIEQHETKAKIDKVFLILLYQLSLYLFSEPRHVKIARSLIKELKSCYEHHKKSKKKSKTVTEGSIVTDQPEWIDVLIEVLLSILSIESSILRSVVQCVFRLLWEYITPSSIEQIISVLDPETEFNPLSEETNSDNENESEQDEVSGESAGASAQSDTEEDDEDDDNMKPPDHLRLAVQEALGTATVETDTESLDADMIDEEEGKKLDEALAEAFRQFHQGKGKKSKKERKDKKSISDFRIRVLDLIDIYLEKDPSMDICLTLIGPLIRCLEFCIQDSQFSELENRVRKTIRVLTKIKKFSTTSGVTIELLCDYLKSTMDKGQRSHFLFQALGDVITYVATFVIHCAEQITDTAKQLKTHQPLIVIFKDTVNNYFQNRNCILPIIFFHNVLQSEWVGVLELIPAIIENIFNNNVRQFRRNEGIDLLAGFFRSLKRSKQLYEKYILKLKDQETIFANTLTKTLQNGTNFEAKPNFFQQLKKLINTIKMFHDGSTVESSLDFNLLLNIVSSCKPVDRQIKGDNEQNQVHNKKGKAKRNKRKLKPQQLNGHEVKKVKRENVST